MKKLHCIFIACCLFFCSFFTAGCYITQAQTMKNIKGTYQLVKYEMTRERYNKEDKIVTTVTDYIERDGLELYLVVTGTNSGYYVYKSNDTPAFAREVALSYQADTEETNKYAKVGYKDMEDSEYSDFGVTKNALNYYRPAICDKLFGLEVNQDGYDMDWKKVDKATDLSYVKKQLGEFACFTYEGWDKHGGYQASFEFDGSLLPEGETFKDPYLYYYIEMDTVQMKATTYFAYPVSEGETPIKEQKTEDITLVNGWDIIKIGANEWAKNNVTFGNYEREVQPDNTVVGAIPYRIVLTHIIRENANEHIQGLISNYFTEE